MFIFFQTLQLILMHISSAYGLIWDLRKVYSSIFHWKEHNNKWEEKELKKGIKSISQNQNCDIGSLLRCKSFLFLMFFHCFLSKK